MKFLKTLYAVAVLAVAPLVSSAQPQESDHFFLHTIAKGQSLYSIASMYRLSVEDIVKLNPGSEQGIKAGETLKIPQQTAQTKQIFHTIQAGETLYKLTVEYDVSAGAICLANPGLSASNFRAGQVIVIPVANASQEAEVQRKADTPRSLEKQESKWQDIHKVKRGETLFSLSRQYHITEEELLAANPELKKKKLKKGSFLAIPYPKKETEETKHTPTNDELFSKNKKEFKILSTIKTAVILPFAADGRMVEYYEGFLLAVDSLKKRGTSLDIYTYDSGTTNASLDRILRKDEMKKMDIIIGPANAEQIKPLTDFAERHKIRIVIPFTSKDNEVFHNPYVFQINTPQSYLYSEVYEHFIRKFDRANVIFLNANDTDKDKSIFINGLKSELKENQIKYTELKGDHIVAESMLASIDSTKSNVFIPLSGSNIALIKLLPPLLLLTKEHPTYRIHLFGYPEWQTYTKDYLSDFYELDTYFYSSFYTNNLFPEAINFSSSFRRWYGKEMANTYPKYGMLGFDTAYYLLYGLSRYGNKVEDYLGKYSVTPIQTGFKFERVNTWGGFINKKVFFVHFSKSGELTKIDFE